MARVMLPSSVKGYMSGVRHHQILQGFSWPLASDLNVRSTLRWVRRRYPARLQAKKVAISLSLLQTIFPLLPHWPHANDMTHDDILFVVASLIGVLGFLRGGEFLLYPGSGRPLLRRSDISIRSVGGRPAVVVAVLQPKARWWLDSVLVPCFANPDDGDFCPLRWWAALSARATSDAPAAFAHADGAPLTRKFMTSRTAALMSQAGIAFVDQDGVPMKVLASSWRAGGVRSAVDAGVAESVIMALGRWRSMAWMHYLIHSPHDFFSATRSMWSRRAPLAAGPSGLVVGVCDTIGSFIEDCQAVSIHVQSIQSESVRPARAIIRPARFNT